MLTDTEVWRSNKENSGNILVSNDILNALLCLLAAESIIASSKILINHLKKNWKRYVQMY